MVDVSVEKLAKFASSSKVFSTQIVKCKLCGSESVDAVVIVFDDGYTKVSCPVDRGNRLCRYEVSPRPTKFYNKPWFVITLLFVLAIVFTLVSKSNILPWASP